MSTTPLPEAGKSGSAYGSALSPLVKSLTLIASHRDTGDLSQDAEEQRSLDLQNRLDAIIALVDAQLTNLPDQQRELIKDNVRTALIEGGKKPGPALVGCGTWAVSFSAGESSCTGINLR